MDASGNADGSPSYSLASVVARVHQSITLIDGARHSSRRQLNEACAMYGRAEQLRARSRRRTSAGSDVASHEAEPTHAARFRAVLDLARAIYPGCAAVSVTTVYHDHARHALRYATVAHTGTAAIADAAQYALDEGPCLEAVAADHPVVVGADDLDSNDPPAWPRFTAATRPLGIRAALSVGIPWTEYWAGPPDVEHPPVGAINFYGSSPYAFFARESAAIALGIHVGSRLTGAEPAEIYDEPWSVSPN